MFLCLGKARNVSSLVCLPVKSVPAKLFQIASQAGHHRGSSPTIVDSTSGKMLEEKSKTKRLFSPFQPAPLGLGVSSKGWQGGAGSVIWCISTESVLRPVYSLKNGGIQGVISLWVLQVPHVSNGNDDTGG